MAVAKAQLAHNLECFDGLMHLIAFVQVVEVRP